MSKPHPVLHWLAGPFFQEQGSVCLWTQTQTGSADEEGLGDDPFIFPCYVNKLRFRGCEYSPIWTCMCRHCSEKGFALHFRLALHILFTTKYYFFSAAALANLKPSQIFVQIIGRLIKWSNVKFEKENSQQPTYTITIVYFPYAHLFTDETRRVLSIRVFSVDEHLCGWTLSHHVINLNQLESEKI